MQLALIHQPVGGDVPAAARLWRTCLRDIAFVRDAAAAGDHVLTDADAYALLLEVVCGLRSPLSGETEVQAQFKAFLRSLDADLDRDILDLGQRVLADAKAIRARHLQGIGVQTYGTLAAGFVRPGRLVVLAGTGSLAADLVATLEDRHRIDQWGRTVDATRPSCALFSTAATAGIRSTEPATLIVAAPVPQADLEAVAACYPGLIDVVDLRGTGGHERLPVLGRSITLDDLFAEAVRRGPGVERLADARREILELSGMFGARERIRPFGWEDL